MKIVRTKNYLGLSLNLFNLSIYRPLYYPVAFERDAHEILCLKNYIFKGGRGPLRLTYDQMAGVQWSKFRTGGAKPEISG